VAMKRRTFLASVGALLALPFRWLGRKSEAEAEKVPSLPDPLDVTRNDAPLCQFTLYYRLQGDSSLPLVRMLMGAVGCANADTWRRFPPGTVRLDSAWGEVGSTATVVFLTFVAVPRDRARWGSAYRHIAFTERFGVPRDPFPSVKKYKLSTEHVA
jgi:hypothetical protein